jgi:hypothetical protein
MSHTQASRSTTAPSFSPSDWDLLVSLPGRVLIAATSVERDAAKHTVAEGLAGIEAIAAGRSSPSRLVRGVLAAIYAEPHDDADTREFADPRSGIASVLAEARSAARTLEGRVADADADAYRDWLIDIATTVCSAARGGSRVAPAERRFLTDLSMALTI